VTERSFFEKLPAQEVHYTVSCEGYNKSEGTINITPTIEDNTFTISLDNNTENILVTGKVTDKTGMKVEGAKVTLIVGEIVESDITNESGRFFIRMDKHKIKYNDVHEYILEAANGKECYGEVKFIPPARDYIPQDIELDCQLSIKEHEFRDLIETTDWKFSLKNCKRFGSQIECNFIVTSKMNRRNLNIHSIDSYSYDEAENKYAANSVSIANILAKKEIQITMDNNTPSQGSIIFTNVPRTVNTFHTLSISILGDDYEGRSIEFYQIPINTRQ
jgi:hypothetical protein